MQNLSSLTNEEILNNISKDCLDKIKAALLQDRSYNLSTYVEIPEAREGLFVIFIADDNHDSWYDGITTHPDSKYLGRHYLRHQPTIHAYWIPASGLNDIFYFDEDPTPDSTLHVTIRDVNPVKFCSSTTRIRINNKDKEQKEFWENEGSPPIKIKYFAPK